MGESTTEPGYRVRARARGRAHTALVGRWKAEYDVAYQRHRRRGLNPQAAQQAARRDLARAHRKVFVAEYGRELKSERTNKGAPRRRGRRPAKPRQDEA